MTLLLLFGIVPLIVFSLLFLKVHYDAQKKNIKSLQKEIAERISADLGGFLSKTIGRIQGQVQDASFGNLEQRELNAFAKRIFKQGLEFKTVTIVDTDGNICLQVSRHRRSEIQKPLGFKEKRSFRTALQGMMYIGGIEISAFSGFPRLHMAFPLRSESGDIRAILDVGTDFTRMSQVISEQSLGKDRFAYVVDREGNIIAQPNLSGGHEKRVIENIPIVRKMLQGTYGVYEYKGLNNNRVIGASTIIPFTGWGVVVEQSTRTAYKDLNMLAALLLGILLVTVSSAFFFGLRFSLKRIVRPVQRLREKADFISKGDFTKRISIQSSDELGELAQSFNDMASKLGKSQETLLQEISERRDAENSLRDEVKERRRIEIELKETYDIISKSPVVVFLWKNAEGWPVEFVSDNVKDIFGYTVEEFKSGRVLYSEIVHPDDLLRVAQEVETNSAEPGRLHFSHEPYRIITKGGNIKWLDDRTYIRRDGQGCVTHYQGIVLDISIRKQMEEERQRLESVLRRSQKMEAIGTLAGGIAHNFNNALMGIQGRTSLMMIDKPQSHPDLEHLKGIEEYVQNAAELTKELLGFARGGKYQVRPANLNELIKYENRMFGQTRKEIRITGKFEENLWTVEVDQGQIRQALLNLYVNAWQAMPAGGELYIQTENVTLDQDYVKPLEIAPGRYVKISVTDTGVGMDDKTQQKIFNPFFTTKGMGEGTGLGLSSVYGIVNNHSGFINVYSKIGVGTTFNIYLPASEKEVVEEKQTTGEIVKGEGTILLVDDEDMIIEVGEKLLKKLGYKVMVSKSGKEAIDVYGKNMNNIDLIVLDMIMPGMGGGDTYDQLKEINPAIKVLLSSGYSINGQAQEILDRGCNGFIQKPFNMKELSKKIEGILDQE